MGKFGTGGLDLSWDIFGYTKQSEDLISSCCYFSRFLEIFKARHGNFGGVLVKSQEFFLGFDLCPHSIILVT